MNFNLNSGTEQDRKVPINKTEISDYMSNKQVRTEVPVDRQTISKYSFVSRSQIHGAAHK